MNETINVKLHDGTIVTAILLKNNRKTVWVRLPDGNVIKRHKQKHVIK